MRKRINIFISLILLVLTIASCSTETKQTVSESKQDSIPTKDSDVVLTEENGIQEAEIKTDYTGTYTLLVTRNESYYIHNKIELTQKGDSIYAVYSAAYYIPAQEPFAEIKGVSKAQVGLFDGNMQGAMLTIDITDCTIDSAKFVSRPWSNSLSIPTKEYGSALAIRFNPDKNNTLENNYAGGEWDTWDKN